MNKNQLMLILVLLCPFSVMCQDILGYWSTIDDNSGKIRSVVQIYSKGNKYYGKVVKISEGEDQNAICEKCDKDDDRYRKQIIGMEILRGAERDGQEYVRGKILDPENGTIYNCKLWIEDDNLMLRGYVTIFYRTQRWEKYTKDI